MVSTIGLSYTGYANNDSTENKSSEIEKLIKQQYSNQSYDLMSMKDSNKGVVSRPSEKEFSANRKTVFAFAVAVAGVFARQFQGGFVGFRTRIAKEDFVGKGVLGQAFG